MSREELLKKYLKSVFDAKVILLEKGYYFSENEIWQILVSEFEYNNNPTEFLHKELSASDIVDILLKHSAQGGEIVGSIILGESIIPESLLENPIIKAIVKSVGEVWEIHRNDPDYFPSDPHAHNLLNGLKLDLSNGFLYKKRRHVDKIRSKDLIEIRDSIQNIMPGLELPPLQI